MNKWKVFGLSGGIAATVVMAGTMFLLLFDPAHSALIVYSIEVWVEFPMMIISALIMGYMLWEEADDF